MNDTTKETLTAIAVVLLILLAMGVVGEMDYQDELVAAGGRK